jgi:DNA-binding HxlR family transcriptional regulator
MMNRAGGTESKRASEGAKTGADAACTGCQIEDLFRLLGKAHMLDILHVIIEDPNKPRRFVDIQHSLDLAPNTLSERLRELTKAGLVSRTAYNEIPPRVDYAPTQKALALRTVFESLATWCRTYDLAATDSTTPTVAVPAK